MAYIIAVNVSEEITEISVVKYDGPLTLDTTGSNPFSDGRNL